MGLTIRKSNGDIEIVTIIAPSLAIGLFIPDAFQIIIIGKTIYIKRAIPVGTALYNREVL